MAAVVGLMLIACLNLANAQLGRSLARRREAAVRTALGAAKWRLVWNALAENLLLAAIGGAAGILLASAGLDLFRRYSPVDLPRLSEVHLNLNVLRFQFFSRLPRAFYPVCCPHSGSCRRILTLSSRAIPAPWAPGRAIASAPG